MINLAIGFFIGWLVFKQPKFITSMISKIREKLGM